MYFLPCEAGEVASDPRIKSAGTRDGGGVTCLSEEPTRESWMRKGALFITVGAIFMAGTFANGTEMPKRDHLVPEMSDFAFGQPIGSDISPGEFSKLYRKDVVARLIADESFVGNWGVGIIKRAGRTRSRTLRIRYPEKERMRVARRRSIRNWQRMQFPLGVSYCWERIFQMT